MRFVWALLFVFATVQAAMAQDYPARNVTFISKLMGSGLDFVAVDLP